MLSMEQNINLIKQNLSIEDIVLLIEDLGATNYKITNEGIVLETICHNYPGEGSLKLYYYHNTKRFRCYTGCGENMDIFDLIIKVKKRDTGIDWSLHRALGYVAQILHIHFETQEFQEIELQDWEIIKNIYKNKAKEESLFQSEKGLTRQYNKTILEHLPKVRIPSWEKEGISKETIEQYNILYNPVDCQIIIPHYGLDNELIGIRGRSLVQQDAEKYGKYRPAILNKIMYNHPLGLALYGLNFNKNNIHKFKKAIIFESEKSVMLYNSFFGKENNIAVACCGSSISKQQMDLLINLDVKEVVIAFDRQFKEIGDEEFHRLVLLLKRIGDRFNKYLTISCIFDKNKLTGYKDSPIDCGKEIFLELYQNRIVL